MTVDRKLVAVVMADVVGYSRLMERDESGTHARLQELKAFIVAKASALGGRLVKTAGDGFLLEFKSATAALRWAIDVQRELAARSAGVPGDSALRLRIGINLGDIIVEGDDIIGDGVNVAARLESIAHPGGICVAAAVWQQLHEDLGVTFVDAGELQVKNIAKPVHVYRVAPAPGDTSGVPIAKGGVSPKRRHAVPVVAFLLLAIAAAIGWYVLRDGAIPSGVAKDDVSMAVAPITGPAGNADLASLAAMVSAELPRAIADRVPTLRVTREGDARYRLDGDVRTRRDDLVVTLRLRGANDRQFAREEIAIARADHARDPSILINRLFQAAVGMFDVAEGRRAATIQSPSTTEDMVARAEWLQSQPNALEHVRETRRLFDEALRRDPAMVRALVGRAETYLTQFYYDYSLDRVPLARAADRDTAAALALNDHDPWVWHQRAMTLRAQFRFDAAFDANAQSRRLDPAGSFLPRALLLILVGRSEEALGVIDERVALMGTRGPEFRAMACHALVHLGRHADAIVECERAGVTGANYVIWVDLAAAYGHTGDLAKAANAKDELLRRVPTFTISRFVHRFSDHPVWIREIREHFVPGLRRAGVPE